MSIVLGILVVLIVGPIIVSKELRKQAARRSGSTSPSSPASTAPVRYEYRMEKFRDERVHGVQARLNRLGKQGWEITTSTHAGSLDFAANRYTVTLRRPRK